MSSSEILILAPHYEKLKHVQVCFFIVANVLKHGIVGAGHACEVVLDTSENAPGLNELLTDKTSDCLLPLLLFAGGRRLQDYCVQYGESGFGVVEERWWQLGEGIREWNRYGTTVIITSYWGRK